MEYSIKAGHAGLQEVFDNAPAQASWTVTRGRPCNSLLQLAYHKCGYCDILISFVLFLFLGNVLS